MAAIRMLFSWLTEKGVLAMNPAREVKTERFSRTEGKTPAFVEGEVQTLLDAVETSTHTGRSLFASLISGDRHHELSGKRWHPRSRSADCRPRQPDHETL
jgi:integrase